MPRRVIASSAPVRRDGHAESFGFLPFWRALQTSPFRCTKRRRCRDVKSDDVTSAWKPRGMWLLTMIHVGL
jgi:hypothetical protein